MHSSLRVLVVGSAIIVATSCSAEKKGSDTGRDTSVAVAKPTSTPAPATNQSVSSWTVTEFGIGPLRAGMTVAEAVKVLERAGLSVTPGDEKGCHYLKWSGPAGVRVMVDSGVVARVEVDSSSVATAPGARVGDAESQIKAAYAGRVAVQPHKYASGGHYLVVTPSPATEKQISESGTVFHIVFETDGQRVTKYRAGKEPQVSYVEGCG
jgi:hypothetical protein